jgi:hypothetical protein
MAGWRSQGDGYRFIRDFYRDVGRSLRFLAAYTGTAPYLTCPGAKYTIFIQKIILLVTTDAAQSLTFRDTATTPVVIAVVPASPGVGVITFDFGDDGIPLTEGKNFDIVPSAAGLAGWVNVEAYARIVPQEALVPADL